MDSSSFGRELSPQSRIAVSVNQYVGTIVGESTSREFRLAVAHETIREQDIIAVDAMLHDPTDNTTSAIRVWAKVQRIERINPLFPAESGHELASTRTDPFDTVLSLSREMVTAVCQIIGSEPAVGGKGKLDQVRYPPRPASSAYRPASVDIDRIICGDLAGRPERALDIATLSNRSDVTVRVDGHDVVTRHVAILAMTGGGKSWAARRLVESLADRQYPIVVFDPRGDYTGLGDVARLRNRVKRFFARFPIMSEDSDKVAGFVGSLAGSPLSARMLQHFEEVFSAAKAFIDCKGDELGRRTEWLGQQLSNESVQQYGLKSDLWTIARVTQAGEIALQNDDQAGKGMLAECGWPEINGYNRNLITMLNGISWRCYKAARHMQTMERTNQKAVNSAEELPTDRRDLVKYGQISIVSLAGYTGELQATIYQLIAKDLFTNRVDGTLGLPVFMVLEEAHNFAPGKAMTPAEESAVMITRQIAQEGRKFGLGLLLISQRPSRLDETTLSQCNSYIIMRMVNPADQSFVRRVVETLSEDEVRMLPNLDVGEAILSGQFINFPVLVTIKPPESMGEREEVDAFRQLEQAHATMSQRDRT